MRLHRRYLPVIIAAGLSALCPVAHAMQFEPAIGAGLAYSDNVNLAAAGSEEDDIVALGYLGATLSEKGGPLRVEAVSSYTHQTYLDDTLDDEGYFNLGSNVQWEQIRGRLFWNVSDYFTQAKIDSLQAGRTSNTQDTNSFTFGPSFYFQPSGAHSISVNPQYQNFYYQYSDTDNQQYSLSVKWLYSMRPTLQVGLDGGVSTVDYDNDKLNPGTDSTSLHAVVAGTGARSSYTVNLGTTRVKRDNSSSTRGFSGDATWLHELTGRSSLHFYLASRLTNTSSSLLDSQLNPDNRLFGSEQISSEVIRDNIMSLVYHRTGQRLNASLRGQLQTVDYTVSPNDRKIYQLGFDLNYALAPQVDSGLSVAYNYLNEDQANRTDKEYSVSGTVSYHLSRKLRTEFALSYRDKSSNLSADEHSAAAVFVGLIWGKGSVPRTGIL